MANGYGYRRGGGRNFYQPGYGYGQYGGGYGPYGYGGWRGGPTWGGTYGGYMIGNVPSDEEIRDMVYDSIDADPIVPYNADIDISVAGGVVTLTGTVPNKRIKHSLGDDAWWVPGVWDINNNVKVSGRRAERARQQGQQGQRGQGGKR